MSRMMLVGSLVGVLVAGMSLGRAGVRAGSEGEPGASSLAAVVHVNFADSGRQGHGLKNMANILKDEPDARIEVVCHGGGIALVEKSRSEHTEEVQGLIKRGVRFVACENTMRRYSIRKEDLLPGVGTVSSGAVEVIRKQQKEGYAYFRP